MRVQLALFGFVFTLTGAFGSTDRSMAELFHKYDQVMLHKKVELVDEVFSQKFLKENGGKAEFVSKVKGLPPVTNKSLLPVPKVRWKKGESDKLFLARLRDLNPRNKAKKEQHGTEFIVVEEAGKLKVDGTLSDGE